MAPPPRNQTFVNRLGNCASSMNAMVTPMTIARRRRLLTISAASQPRRQ